MGSQEAVQILRLTLETTLWISAPLLAVALVVGLIINVGQVLTSLQEATVAIVPKLAAVAAAVFLLMPWMTRRMVMFTLQMMSDFRPFTK